MRAMILAAGLGTRLRPITDQIPKPLVPVVGVPNIVRTILRLKEAGIDEIVINTFSQPKVLKARLGDGAAFDVQIAYSDEAELLGTGGGIRKALPLIGKDPFIVVNGDSLFAPDFHRILAHHKASSALATLVLRSAEDFETYEPVGIDASGRVRRLISVGTRLSDLTLRMFTGVHVIEPDIAPYLPDEGCIVRKAYVPLLERGAALCGTMDESFFCDLGTPERFHLANMDLVSGRARIAGYEPNPEGIYIGKEVRLGKGCWIREGAVICDGATLADGVTVEESVVMEGVRVTRDLRRAIAAENCLVQI